MALKRSRSMCVRHTMAWHRHLQVSERLQNSRWHPTYDFIVLQTARQCCTGTQSEQSNRTCCILTGALGLRFFEKPAQFSLSRLGLDKVPGSHCSGLTGRNFIDPCACSLAHRGKCCWLPGAKFESKQTVSDSLSHCKVLVPAQMLFIGYDPIVTVNKTNILLPFNQSINQFTFLVFGTHQGSQ